METVFKAMEQAHGDISRERVKEDLRVLARDAEELLKATAGDMTDRAKEARSRLGEALEKAKVTCRRLEEKTLVVAQSTDQLVRDHPYEAIGAAFGVGVLIGILIGRRQSE